MKTTFPASPHEAAKRPGLADRLADAALRVALAVPAALVASLIVTGLATAAPAETPACAAQSLLPKLQVEGRLAAIEAAAAAVPNGEGKLFRVEKAGLPASYLFGTMHLSDPRVLALGLPAESAFDGAARLVVETTDMLDPLKVTGVMLARPDLTTLPKGKTLADYLNPAEMAEVTKELGESGVPVETVQTLQPWFFATSLMLLACEAARMAGGKKPLDLVLADRAAAAGKQVLGLESATEQLEAMASLPMETQVAALLSALAAKDVLPDMFETMTELYLDGRIAMITPVSEAMVPLGAADADAGYAAFEERVVLRRNHVMAERLRPILRQGDTFVAVGALHLSGVEGLVELLRADGFTVTRVD